MGPRSMMSVCVFDCIFDGVLVCAPQGDNELSGRGTEPKWDLHHLPLDTTGTAAEFPLPHLYFSLPSFCLFASYLLYAIFPPLIAVAQLDNPTWLRWGGLERLQICFVCVCVCLCVCMAGLIFMMVHCAVMKAQYEISDIRAGQHINNLRRLSKSARKTSSWCLERNQTNISPTESKSERKGKDRAAEKEMETKKDSEREGGRNRCVFGGVSNKELGGAAITPLKAAAHALQRSSRQSAQPSRLQPSQSPLCILIDCNWQLTACSGSGYCMLTFIIFLVLSCQNLSWDQQFLLFHYKTKSRLQCYTSGLESFQHTIWRTSSQCQSQKKMYTELTFGREN